MESKVFSPSVVTVKVAMKRVCVFVYIKYYIYNIIYILYYIYFYTKMSLTYAWNFKQF